MFVINRYRVLSNLFLAKKQNKSLRLAFIQLGTHIKPILIMQNDKNG
jgi:hypothetical protein